MNKVAVVTGGAKGIGAAVCRRLAADGFSVAVLYRTSQQEAEALVAELCAVTDAICVPVDVTDAASVTAAFEQVTRELGPVYALVNNAGVAAQELLTDVTDGAWNTMIETDLGSVFRCCRAALSHMLHSHDGRIVNIASMWGEIGGSMETPYSAAKAGVIGLTKALAKEVGPSGITVNAVSPGVIRTDMLAAFSDETLAELAAETPLGRIGEPNDVAGAVSFLLSADAAFITGVDLSVSGGFVI